MASDADDDDDLLLVLAIGAGLAILYSYFRSTPPSDASSGAFSFPGTAPGTGSPLGDMLNVLTPMTTSPAGRALIQTNEGGFQAYPYGDAGGQSIGYGHYIQAGDNIVPPITQSQAQALFDDDIGKVESAINSSVTAALNQDQFDALADFVYNVGTGAFQTSTLLRLLNSGDYAGAAAQFAAWNLSQGRVNPALVARRQNEQDLFNMGSGTGSMTATTGSVG